MDLILGNKESQGKQCLAQKEKIDLNPKKRIEQREAEDIQRRREKQRE